MMQETYNLITDEAALNKFVEWLPFCKPHEQYYIALFARKKYANGNPAVTGDKLQLKRVLATKERIVQKIKQMQCPVGSYLGTNDLPIPQESLALYISPNPRDLRKSCLKCICALAKVVENDEESPNPSSEILNVIQTTKSNTHFHIFDIDSKDKNIIRQAIDICGGECSIVETRGGYHLLVNESDRVIWKDKFHKNWYVELKKLSDVTGDALIPVVGAYQGGWTPILTEIINNIGWNE